ncbi:MAG: TonB-dependent receptor plug domain-containing protein [Muribaculaceae bacterium]|nr:TonB-dependent receptor plug domain-containing protein [Muribaculaceae bacterium]
MEKVIILLIILFSVPSSAWCSDPKPATPPKEKTDTLRKSDLSDGIKLGEVVITARESQGITSSSKIDRSAMQHLQPTSFTDLLELLPGNISQIPDMGKVNTITLRETGGVSATGAKSSLSDDYAITSLGTLFMVDGAPINGDANLQSVPSASTTDPEGRRSTTNKGVDMRSLSTDDIESIEIVRGIPSAEYGNLTSGLVNIKRVRRATPFTGRFKADEYSKLFSAGKGVALGRQLMNFDIGYLDSRVDPRDSRENYKRLNGSIRGRLAFGSDSADVRSEWDMGVDFTGSFDNVKPDPDLNYNKIDEYESSYRRWAFNTSYTVYTKSLRWLNAVNMTASASYQNDKLTRRKQVAPQRASVAPTGMEAGIYDGHYLLGEYIADFVSDGRPLALFVKLKADGKRRHGIFSHNYLAGAEWQMSKNYGHGQIYDLQRPLSASWSSRPRDFSTIPALHVVSAYVEDNIRATMGSSSVEVQLGVRTQSLAGLDKQYWLSHHTYIDPRANAVWNLPWFDVAESPMRLLVAGGFGLTTKMPTVDYLYPQLHYNDMIQLNYYDTTDPAKNSRISLRTYIDNPVNYDLRAARNRKWEVRVGADWKGNRVSVTFFKENMSSGYRYSSVYDSYMLRRYDASVITPGSLTAPPSLESLPYTDVNILDGYRRVTNGSRIDKSGIEYQINTVRWMPLRTSLIITGAWFKSRYSNSQMLYIPVNDVVGGTAVSDNYVGLYATDDGRINEQFNTNFMFDTQIPRWGLLFTTTVQCMWFVKTTRLRDHGTPIQYLSAQDGMLHPYTEADANDVMKQYLVRHLNEASFATQTVPPAIYLNLKATKQIGKWMRISAFVNRIVDYLPEYKSNGVTIRRLSDVYFGMEANITL